MKTMTRTKRTIDVQNVNVDLHPVHLDGTRCFLGWEHDGCRFHIWENDPTTLFKNPPLGVTRGNPGHFKTRYLNATAGVNARMIESARAIAVERGLYEEAKREVREERLAKEQEQLAAVVLKNKREAAEDLYDALKSCDDAFVAWQVGQIPGRPEDILALIIKVRAALAKADGVEEAA